MSATSPIGHAPTGPVATAPRVLVLACGALARELRGLVELNGWRHATIECLPAELHNRPERIPDAVRERLASAVNDYDHILLGYADCGTGGLLDELCEADGIERLPGAHCYEFFAGQEQFAALHEEAIGTLYLTDYLARHFDRLIMKGLGVEAHPELRDLYFGNYTRVVHLVQNGESAYGRETARRAEAAAARLGLPLETVHTGYGELGATVVAFTERAGTTASPSTGSRG